MILLKLGYGALMISAEVFAKLYQLYNMHRYSNICHDQSKFAYTVIFH